jgi:FAD/FMN-containing dehydrogenase
MTIVSKDRIDKLKSEIKGQIVMPDDSNYDQVREIWNAMIDRKPAVIVQCAEADDVSKAILFAKENELEISIRGAGHNIAGNSVCDNGIMIDLSNMKKVLVDATKRRAYVEPGVTLGDFDEAVQAHGLATPVGINSTTGIAGLTLGGGFGWLTRQYGMTVDNLLSAKIVSADGQKMRISDKEHADLFWAIRGGGGNFGVVTEFEFQLYSVGPQILAGLIAFPLDEAKQILQQYREFIDTAPEELNVYAVLRAAPPLPFLPEEIHGKNIILLALFYNGDENKGWKFVESLRSFGNPHGEHVGVMPYVQWQKAFDPLLTPGARNYWKSHNFTELSDEMFDTIIEYTEKLPTPQCELFVALLSGSANRVPAEAMAYSNRKAKFLLNVHGRWDNKEEDDAGITWARDLFNATAPHESDGVYINFMTEEESNRVATAYGSNYDRLVQIKKRYDPENVFHMNHNIVPR